MVNLFDSTGKVVLVTGGSRGLGREMALGFAQHGADVVVSSRKAQDCARVAVEIEALGRKALTYPCHVGQWDALPGLVEAAYDISKSWRERADRDSAAALKRIGRPQEIVTTALYLASDHSSFTTGATIELDGGLP